LRARTGVAVGLGPATLYWFGVNATEWVDRCGPEQVGRNRERGAGNGAEGRTAVAHRRATAGRDCDGAAATRPLDGGRSRRLRPSRLWTTARGSGAVARRRQARARGG
jgi:hypothetical protein